MALYDVLLALTPSPLVELNRAVAVAMRDGPEAGLALLDAWPTPPSCAATTSCPRPAATCSPGSGAPRRRPTAYRAALDLVGNEPERAQLTARLDDVTG